MLKIRRCPHCKAYTLKDVCTCGSKTSTAHPLKFSANTEKHRKQFEKL